MKWQEFYSHPFVKEGLKGVVYSMRESNYLFEFKSVPQINQTMILDRLNGLGQGFIPTPNLRYCAKDSVIIEYLTHQKTENILISIKKWGGWKGTLGLSIVEAKQKQDEFGEWIVKQLTKK